MAKAPIFGAVKTRLHLPPYRAAALQAAFVRDTVEKARALELGPVSIAGTSPDRLFLLEPLLSEQGVKLVAQSRENLGERMFSAAATLIAQAETGPVLILGTHSPTLSPDRLRSATRDLKGGRPGESSSYYAAIVGSTDGGYVLLGLWESYKELFRSIEWYTGTVYRETIGKARALGLHVHEGEPHYDVDTPKTWSTSKKSSKKAPIRPHTRRSS
jgi:glycosyltransferase A (GT-A) superfamily protein (DUF2064 family)